MMIELYITIYCIFADINTNELILLPTTCRSEYKSLCRCDKTESLDFGTNETYNLTLKSQWYNINDNYVDKILCSMQDNIYWMDWITNYWSCGGYWQGYPNWQKYNCTLKMVMNHTCTYNYWIENYNCTFEQVQKGKCEDYLKKEYPYYFDFISNQSTTLSQIEVEK